ncbi:DUF177 domain-containing protein [Ottowia sp.]|uniref:YceD family protein n=1 Tax=Ottowia sp. TaxID=1898956 RepID=UPI001DD44F10|nr:DUF177 domain-containing protein [Ottowia sp.]MCP5257782.1 DUF177 domain-containing protein [Burkholderiaceae bacterium]MCB2024323.1 DUF177 domain-containing protein [Ottowia sp.]MCB2032786.1 DUF177 domain-containing protein [Ottowia sp.]HPR43153.1 DUF177 domain-containing protein [Ottowia sp.]HRW73107.1 DUF177 domain-containing protein [Ottowia sp.]
MTTRDAPRKLDVARLAQARQTLASTELLQHYERLAQECKGPVADLTLKWQATGETRSLASGSSHPALHLRAETALPLTCQRCLGEVPTPVAVDRHFVFLPDEDTAAALDDDEEDDLLVLARDFDLHAMIEDEMLLALPLVPMHETCPAPVKTVAQDADFDAAGGERPNPFAALAALKKRS